MDQMRLVFLGTSAGLPSKRRNVASLAVVFDGRTVLFDCGEGTQQQILGSSVRMQSIEAIFVSHLHGDHCYGLPGLLATMSLSGRTGPLALFGIEGLRDYVEGVIRTTRLHLDFDLTVTELAPGERREFAGYGVTTAALEHSRACLGFALVENPRPGLFDPERAAALGVPEGAEFGRLQRGEDLSIDGRMVRSGEVVGPARPGRRVVYCTDTRPCAASVELARGADVLVHEATYDDSFAAEAAERAHATAREAATVAAAAGVAQLVLTHVSPRYDDCSTLLAQARDVFPATVIAEDFFELAVAAKP